jgi:hypothetical protein
LYFATNCKRLFPAAMEMMQLTALCFLQDWEHTAIKTARSRTQW